MAVFGELKGLDASGRLCARPCDTATTCKTGSSRIGKLSLVRHGERASERPRIASANDDGSGGKIFSYCKSRAPGCTVYCLISTSAHPRSPRRFGDRKTRFASDRHLSMDLRLYYLLWRQTQKKSLHLLPLPRSPSPSEARTSDNRIRK